MKNTIDVLIDRDGMSREEAEEMVKNTRKEIWDVLANDGGYNDIEEILMQDYGLEMDYIFDFI